MLLRKFIWLALPAITLAACNNSKSDGSTVKTDTSISIPRADRIDMPTTTSGGAIHYTVDGKNMQIHASPLVSKDKKNVSPGNDYMAMVTANDHSDGGAESVVLNFVFSLKEGTYPIVGYSYVRHVDGKAQMFGGLLGGEEKISPYKITLTSLVNVAGHHWVMSGTVDGAITIPAMGIMLMDKTSNHPKDVTIDKISFSNLQFDDNFDELMQKGLEQMQRK